jgi:hypothetical protein
MSNRIQFEHNLKKAKRQRKIERLKIDACLYFGQQYHNIKHNELIVNHLLQRYIDEVGT